MAAISVSVKGPYETINGSPKFLTPNINESTDLPVYCSTAATVDEYEIPTLDYFMLFTNDRNQRSNALNYLSHVCQDYGFFYVYFPDFVSFIIIILSLIIEFIVVVCVCVCVCVCVHV